MLSKSSAMISKQSWCKDSIGIERLDQEFSRSYKVCANTLALKWPSITNICQILFSQHRTPYEFTPFSAITSSQGDLYTNIWTLENWEPCRNRIWWRLVSLSAVLPILIMRLLIKLVYFVIFLTHISSITSGSGTSQKWDLEAGVPVSPHLHLVLAGATNLPGVLLKLFVHIYDLL